MAPSTLLVREIGLVGSSCRAFSGTFAVASALACLAARDRLLAGPDSQRSGLPTLINKEQVEALEVSEQDKRLASTRSHDSCGILPL